MNQSDAERIRSVIEQMGYERTDTEEEADLLGIVACSVRQKAIDRVYHRIHKWNEWKNDRNLLTFVSGCILPADREKFLDRFDLLFTINELPHLPEMIRQYGIVTPASVGQTVPELLLEDDAAPAGTETAAPASAGGGQVTGDGTGVAEAGQAAADGNGVAEAGQAGAPSAGQAAGDLPTHLVAAGRDGEAGAPSAGQAAGATRAAPPATDTVHARHGDELPEAIRARNAEKAGAGGTGVGSKAGSAAASTARVVRERASEQSAEEILKKLVPESSTKDEDKGYWHITPSYSSSFEAFVPIQNGCDKFCTFCAVPYTRGREVSRPSAEILGEVERLVEQGYKSITLLGQNVNSYGLDRKSDEISFAELLRRIGQIGERSAHEFWVYFTSPHPRDMTDEVIEAIARYDCLANQIHLPIQSGDDKVLIRMNRNYRVSQYRRVVESIRRMIPEATLFTDIIVGFSGETEEQFEHTREAMREFQYNMAFVAPYSPRPGAASARWEDDVPEHEKKRRLNELNRELQASARAYNESLIGTTLRMLVEGPDRKEGYLNGKSEGKLTVRFPSTDESLIGQIVTVEIAGTGGISLEGDLVADSAKKHTSETVGAR
jgi:MiaB/RimO family radical SAM methylthiotransferase